MYNVYLVYKYCLGYKRGR